jgi:UDP-glucose 4-epimerase
MRYMVTGGAGFIGGHLVESLIKDGHEVKVVDDLSTGCEANLANVSDHPNFEFIKGDIIDLPELDYLVSTSDIVYHLAAAVGVKLVVKDPVQTIITNVHGTERILKAAKKNKNKIILTSTSEVYGKSEKKSFAEEDDLIIGPPTHSRWSYACSKLLDEFYCMAFANEYDIPVTVVRLFNTVGPRQTGKYGMVVPRFVKNALLDRNLKVYGTGEQTRCFCHVFDTVRALRILADSSVNKMIFNIGNDHEISINKLAEYVIKKLNSYSGIERVSYDKAYSPGFEDMKRRYPNISKIASAIDWEPVLTLDDIIDDVANYIKQKKIYENS